MKQTLCVRLRKAILSFFFLMNNVFVSKKMKRKKKEKEFVKVEQKVFYLSTTLD